MVQRALLRLIRQTRSESGQSLVLAFIVMCALSITVGGVISFTTSNESQFGRDRQLDRAFHIAEAGLNNGIEVIEKKDSVERSDADRHALSGGSGTTYSLSLDGGTRHVLRTEVSGDLTAMHDARRVRAERVLGRHRDRQLAGREDPEAAPGVDLLADGHRSGRRRLRLRALRRQCTRPG